MQALSSSQRICAEQCNALAMIGPLRATLSCFPEKLREAEHRTVQWVENCTCYQVQPRSLLQDRSPFGAPLRIVRSCLPTRPGPALPGITGSLRGLHTLSGTSAVGTLQSEHVPDGHDAQAACELS